MATQLPRIVGPAPRPMTVTAVRPSPLVSRMQLIAQPQRIGANPRIGTFVGSPSYQPSYGNGLPGMPSTMPSPSAAPALISMGRPSAPKMPSPSSPTTAPDFLATATAPSNGGADGSDSGTVNDVPIEQALPAITAPTDKAYAPDANWIPFTNNTDNAASAQSDDSNLDFKVLDDGAAPVVDPAAVALVKVTAQSASAASATVAKVNSPSFIDRILSLFGLSRKAAATATMAGEGAAMATMSQTEAAYQLVRRARNGDQNAMAMIVCVREAAARGNPKAKMSARYMREYILAHPVADTPEGFGAEDMLPRTTPHPLDKATAAAVQLSHGPLLTNPRIDAVVREAGFGAEEIHAFTHGVAGRAMRNPDPRIQRANKMGGLIGHARKLQRVRMPNIPVTKFDANIGWELGEDLPA